MPKQLKFDENARRGLTHNVGATGGTVVVNVLRRA